MDRDSANLFQRAVDGFRDRLFQVRDGQWSDPTPCSDWTVRDLVNHVTNELLWVVPLLEGQTPQEIGSRFDGDMLGDDPYGSLTAAAETAEAAVTTPGALKGVVHLAQDTDTEQYIQEVTSDITVHTWDLARAVKVDEQLDPELVQLAASTFEPLAGGGAFGPQITVEADASPQAQLLALTGRRDR